MAKLITGGSGMIGAALAHMLVERGEKDIIIFDRVKSARLDDIEGAIKFVKGDLSNHFEVFSTVKDNQITEIFHMAAIPAYEADASPWNSLQINALGTYYVLEAARLFNVSKVIFTSTLLTYNPETDPEITEDTIQRPTEISGVDKLYGEGVGRYYRKKYGLDFRSIRYPAILGPGILLPTHWDGPMIDHAVRGEPYKATVSEDTSAPMMYLRDAVKAADMISKAPKDSIKKVNYNVAGTPVVSAKELEQTIRKIIPGVVVTYPNIKVPPHILSYIKVWDDSYARKEWGWEPDYPAIDQVVSTFIADLKAE